MPQLLFHLVGTIVASRKYFDVSRDEIVRALIDDGEYETYADFPLEGKGAGADSVPLRLNIHCGKYVQAWTISLKLHLTRLDGIDYQTRYYDSAGKLRKGWHRNGWNTEDEEANRHEPIKGFDDVESIDQFLIRAFK